MINVDLCVFILEWIAVGSGRTESTVNNWRHFTCLKIFLLIRELFLFAHIFKIPESTSTIQPRKVLYSYNLCCDICRLRTSKLNSLEQNAKITKKLSANIYHSFIFILFYLLVNVLDSNTSAHSVVNHTKWARHFYRFITNLYAGLILSFCIINAHKL